MTATDMPGRYVYGIVPAEAGSAIVARGLEDQPIETVVHGALGALVSAVGDEPVGRRRELVRHAEVLDEAMRETPVLPLQFGMLVDDDEQLIGDVLAPRHDELVELLAEIEGFVELRLRGYYDETVVLSEIVAERPELQQSGTGLHERIRVGEQVVEALEDKRDDDAAGVLDRLSPLAHDARAEPVTTEMMAFNLAFLLAEGDVERFDRAVQEVGAALEGRLSLKYVGPLPPATFVDLSLPRQEA